MIILEMTGGLGNQMFQYAFGKACSARVGEPLFLDLTQYRRRKNKREFLLDKMRVSLDHSFKSPLYAKLLQSIKRPRVIQDKGFFEEKNLDVRGNIMLCGWWESPLYFKNIEDAIEKEFTLKKPSERLMALSKTIGTDSIAVHVRRGDYLVPHGKYLNGIDYYSKAVEYILKNKALKDPEIVIFSDDPEWCRTELKSLAGRSTGIFEKRLDSDAEELTLMSLYGNNVISNSTFSWWAAYLNRNPDKTVVMPKNWYTDPERNERYLAGISVPGWIGLE